MSEAAVILPGGIGTLEEAFQIITWKQLRQHNNPIVLVNVDDYWTNFIQLLKSVIDGEFAHEKTFELFTVIGSVDDISAALANPPEPDMVALNSHP